MDHYDNLIKIQEKKHKLKKKTFLLNQDGSYKSRKIQRQQWNESQVQKMRASLAPTPVKNTKTLPARLTCFPNELLF